MKCFIYLVFDIVQYLHLIPLSLLIRGTSLQAQDEYLVLLRYSLLCSKILCIALAHKKS